MLKTLKKIMIKMYEDAMQLNDDNVCRALTEIWISKRLLDIGCWDWEKTLKYIDAAHSTENYWIELIQEQALKANKNWIKTISCYADKDRRPFEDNFFDVIVSNQVIEHLSNVDIFFQEAYRVLKPWWYLVTSTNNLSSWHNIIALIFWWAPFDLTNSSTQWLWIWNPFAVHSWEKTLYWDSRTHKCIYTTKRLNNWQNLYKLKSVKHYGSWYYPLPAIVWNIFKKHSAFITLVNQK